jgi:hypothetical protein
MGRVVMEQPSPGSDPNPNPGHIVGFAIGPDNRLLVKVQFADDVRYSVDPKDLAIL